MMDTTTLDLSSLTDDGDTLELPDGRTLRLRIEGDDTDPFMEFGEEAYGKLARVERSSWSIYDEPRPEGFTGRAVKIDDPRGGRYWYEAPADAVDPASWARTARDLIMYGMSGYVLEVLDGTDAYGRSIVTDVASSWGIEPFPDREYVRTLVSDLASELDL